MDVDKESDIRELYALKIAFYPGNERKQRKRYTMNWEKLTSLDQLEAIRKESAEKPVLIFKHSTRCSISRMVLDRLERNWDVQEMGPRLKAYFLDLISYRQISNQIAELFDVEHESPQVLIIRDGSSVYDRSHMEIDYQHIRDTVKS